MGRIWDRLKEDNETFFALNMFLLIMLALGFLMMPECSGCTYRDKLTGEEVLGNCGDIKQHFVPRYYLPSDADIIPVADVYLEELNKSPEIFNTTPSTTLPPIDVVCHPMECPPQIICPDCPECKCFPCLPCPNCTETMFTDVQVDWLLNDCQIRDGATCIQTGSAMTCDRFYEYFKVPGRPKYSTRPSNVDIPMYGGYKAPDDGRICFIDANPSTPDMEFYLNNSIWMISNEGSMKWVHKI